MADPMTREKLRDLLSDMECGAGPDGGDIMAACDDLIAQERAEVERLRAELVEATGTAYKCANCGLWHHDDEPAEQDVRCDECGHAQPRDEAEFLPAYTAVKAERDAFRLEAADTAAKRDAAETRIEELEDGWDRDAKRLRAELAEARRGKVDQMLGRLNDWSGDLATVVADRDRLAGQVKRARARHRGVCHGACGLDDACECEERDLFCEECSEQWPCGTARDLDGTEAGR